MRTIRGRLAAWYAVALAGTMFVFAAIVYLVQRRESSADLDERIRLESELIAATLSEAYRARGRLVVEDENGRHVLHPDVLPFLEGIPGLVVVVGPSGDVLHLSAEARALPYGSLVRLLGPAFQMQGPGFGTVDIGGPAAVRYFAVPITEAGTEVSGILSGVSAEALILAPKRLLIAMLLVAPVILAASVGVGYLLVGRTLQTVDRIVDEVEAISDGRSLHRRLAPSESHDELGRLTTTLNAMIGRLERSFATLRRFTADASHELKTPLTVLRSGIERAITHPAVSPEVLETLDETLIEVNRMAELVDSLLTLARVDEGRAPLHLEELDLRDLLSEIAETGGILGEQAAVAVEVRIPDDAIPLAADRERMRQLLMNLLTNAIKYTPAGGEVAVGSARGNGTVEITVRDTGIGIAPGDLPHIFDRFWRADPARSRTGQRPGVGLGLAISKWIAEAHGGSIRVTSRPKRGTTFTVALPVVGQTADRPPAVVG